MSKTSKKHRKQARTPAPNSGIASPTTHPPSASRTESSSSTNGSAPAAIVQVGNGAPAAAPLPAKPTGPELPNTAHGHSEDRKAKLAIRLAVASLVIGNIGIIGNLLQHWRWSSDRDRSQLERQERLDSEKATTHRLTMIEIGSDSAERRLSGFRAAKDFIASAEYRVATRAAIIQSVGKRLAEFAGGTLAASDFRTQLNGAGDALAATSDCEHLEAAIRELHERITASSFSLQEMTRLENREVERRLQALAMVRDAIGTRSYCAFLPKCAGRLDFRNGVDAEAVTIDFVNMGGPAKAHRPKLHPRALLDLTANPIEPHGEDATATLHALGRCKPEERAAIEARACDTSPSDDTPSSFMPVPLRICGWLKRTTFLEGDLLQIKREDQKAQAP